MVLSTLAPNSAGFSFSLATWLRTKTVRIGKVLALVGPHSAISTASFSKASGTGLSRKALWVRASRKSWSSAAGLRVGVSAMVSIFLAVFSIGVLQRDCL